MLLASWLCLVSLQLGAAKQPNSTRCMGQSTNLEASECASWREFFVSTVGSKWEFCSDRAADPCGCEARKSGKAITCDSNGKHITVIKLDSNNLQGKLPILKLPYLQRLNLAYNELSGSVPDLSHLSSLHRLDLHVNKFSGELPPSMNQLSELKYLKIDNNELRGTLPQLDRLGKLVGLEMYSNQLTGSVPKSILRLPKVCYVVLSHCSCQYVTQLTF